MKCPRCGSVMQARAIAESDATRVTNHLCLSCLFRQIERDKNNIVSVGQKSPVPVTAGLPHKRRRPIIRDAKLLPISTVAVSGRTITQEEIDAAVNDEPDAGA